MGSLETFRKRDFLSRQKKGFADVGPRRVEKSPMKKAVKMCFCGKSASRKVPKFFGKNRESREKNEKNSRCALDKAGGRWYNGNRRVPVSVAKRRL